MLHFNRKRADIQVNDNTKFCHVYQSYRSLFSLKKNEMYKYKHKKFYL